MGTTLVRLLVIMLASGVLSGCGKMSADSVRDKDQQRIDTAKGMPGNDLPPDPADVR